MPKPHPPQHCASGRASINEGPSASAAAGTITAGRTEQTVATRQSSSLLQPWLISDEIESLTSHVRIYKPSSSDVLVGRGRPYQSHVGNQRMLQIINKLRETYKESERQVKSDIIEEVLAIVGSRGGRFLTRVDYEEYWVQVTRSTSYRKVGHAFRSKARQSKSDIARSPAANPSTCNNPNLSIPVSANQQAAMAMFPSTVVGTTILGSAPNPVNNNAVGGLSAISPLGANHLHTQFVPGGSAGGMSSCFPMGTVAAAGLSRTLPGMPHHGGHENMILMPAGGGGLDAPSQRIHAAAFPASYPAIPPESAAAFRRNVYHQQQAQAAALPASYPVIPPESAAVFQAHAQHQQQGHAAAMPASYPVVPPESAAVFFAHAKHQQKQAQASAMPSSYPTIPAESAAVFFAHTQHQHQAHAVALPSSYPTIPAESAAAFRAHAQHQQKQAHAAALPSSYPAVPPESTAAFLAHVQHQQKQAHAAAMPTSYSVVPPESAAAFLAHAHHQQKQAQAAATLPASYPVVPPESAAVFRAHAQHQQKQAQAAATLPASYPVVPPESAAVFRAHAQHQQQVQAAAKPSFFVAIPPESAAAFLDHAQHQQHAPQSSYHQTLHTNNAISGIPQGYVGQGERFQQRMMGPSPGYSSSHLADEMGAGVACYDRHNATNVSRRVLFGMGRPPGFPPQHQL